MKKIALVTLSLLFLIGAAQKGPVTTAELTDPAGDVQRGMTSDGPRAAFDVVHLTLTSDGKNVLVAATLKDAPGTFASTVVTLYFDTDNKPSTGVKTFFSEKPGFEYVSDVDACIKTTDGASACVGGFGKNAKIQARYGIANVEKFGATSTDKTTVRSSFDAPEIPLDGKIVRASIAYADLGVKPGQVIRILAREVDASSEENADFPDVFLKLK